MKKKMLSVLLAVCMLAAMLTTSMVAFAADAQAFKVDVQAAGKTVTVTITLPGSAKAAGANCTLQYDNTKLAFAKTVEQANGNMVNPNYRENAVRFSFAQPLATTTDTVMWKMEFTLKSGTVSANDFAVTAFKLYDDNAELISSEATVDTTIHFSCLHTQTAENITLQPTHTASGTKEVVCSTCGEQLQVETLPATGHTFGAWEVVRPATCTEPGEEMRRCSCGATESREIAVTEHTPGAWETELQPTCTENGKRVQKCTVCGTVLAQETVSPTGHSFGDWIVVKEATVTEEGLKERTCSVCGEKETQSIPKLEKPVITSISVSTLPDKTKYVQGETFSADGLRLQINYNNETSEIITSGFTVSAPNMETPGTKTVTVTYEGKSTSFTISVVENSVANPTAAHVYAESVKARPGETIQIPLYVESNPGVAYVKFKVAYDSNKLDLISAEDQGVFKGIYTTSQTIDVNPYVLQWMNAGNATGNGCFAILTFKVLDDATEGDITVQITYDEACNETLDDVAFTFTSPTVAIRDYIPGDINDDGVVNGKDGILLSQYLAEWDKEINLDAADVNGDNIVNGKDSIILSQYLASWDVELGK